jgi:crotonobetainyl-CoA:carnitine CoA-transferase CaiB-like acyl-CoA transferase
LTRTPAQIRRPAPGWGEHTREMLAEMGYAADDIERLYEEGVV